MHNKTVIVIGGPTAVGKTAVAINIARYFGAEIISADSRQCYKELAIGVARPSEAELAAVPHYFIASHSIHQKVTAVTFEQYALEKTAELFQTSNVVVMVGGTGLYIQAFCNGLDDIPEVPEAVRMDLLKSYEEKGLPWLQGQVAALDADSYAKMDIQNPHRLLRALEVVTVTGTPIAQFRKGKKADRPFSIVKMALELPKPQLHQNIETRVDAMVAAGLVEEVKNLLPYQHLNALQTVGYKEIFQYLKGNISLSAAVEDIKKNTRQYAKRQLTWFKKGDDFQWFAPDNENAYMGFLKSCMCR